VPAAPPRRRRIAARAAAPAAAAGRDAEVLQALRVVIDPDFGEDIVTCGFVQALAIDEAAGAVAFTLELTTPACPVKEVFLRQSTEAVKARARARPRCCAPLTLLTRPFEADCALAPPPPAQSAI